MSTRARRTTRREQRGGAAAWPALVVASLVALSPLDSQARQPRTNDRSVSDGVARTYHDYSGEGDASSLELNPALLSTIRGFDLTLRGFAATSPFIRGSGFGAFAALNLGLGFALGLGAQYVDNGLGDDTFDALEDFNPRTTKLSLGLSGGMGDFGALGVSVNGVRSEGQWLRQPDVDLGLLSRILNWGSIGVNARFGPAGLRSEDFPARLQLIAEAAVRPLGTHHLELAAGVNTILLEGDPGEAVDPVGTSGILPRGRIAVRWEGLALRGEVEQVRTTVLDPDTLVPIGDEKAVRGSVSLEASWDFFTLGGGVTAGISDDGVDGFDLYARLHSRRRGRVVPIRPIRAERLELGAVTDDRSLIAMLQRLEGAEAAGERSILVVDLRGVATGLLGGGAGWANLHELRDALIDVRNAGGHVFAYLESASLPDYYLASVAEKIFMHPAGDLQTYGISSTSLYFGDALARLGVKAEVVRIGAYKSAAERFTTDGPSREDRFQREAYISDVYDQILYDVARGRGLSIDEVRERFDDSPHGPQDAVELGLVDQVVFRDELIDAVSDAVGTDVDFGSVPDVSHPDPTWSEAPYIGLVLVEDTIIDGENQFIPFIGLNFTGGDTIARTLAELRSDPMCKGIVLRVDSPGGSALASDIIWRQVAQTSKAFREDPDANPPIVVSMGDVAASGGYYVAMGADTVFAEPTTLTGSIGVISINLDVSGLLQKLGISTATFKEGANPDINSPFAPLTPDQRQRIETSIQRTYDLFRQRVAEGRDVTMERVDELGRGRIYSGVDALDVGLVDEMGGLLDALDRVRTLADVPAFRELELRVYPKKQRLLDLILDQVGNPFGSRGGLRKAVAKRRARERAEALSEALPLVLDAALSRLPLSGLFLRSGQAHAIMSWRFED